MLDYKDTFDKNAKVFELKDYYFNLRTNIYRMKNFDFVQSNCNKLMALAVLTKDLFGEQSLTDRVVIDIKDVIEKKFLPRYLHARVENYIKIRENYSICRGTHHCNSSISGEKHSAHAPKFC